MNKEQEKLTKSSNLLINWMTPIIWPREFLIAMQRMDLCLNDEFSSTLGSKRGSSYAFGMVTVCGFKAKSFRRVESQVDDESTHLTRCSDMPCYADIYGKARLEGTSTRRFAIFIEIIIRFKIKYTRKTSFGCFMYKQYLNKCLHHQHKIVISGWVNSPVLFGTVLSFAYGLKS